MDAWRAFEGVYDQPGIIGERKVPREGMIMAGLDQGIARKGYIGFVRNRKRWVPISRAYDLIPKPVERRHNLGHLALIVSPDQQSISIHQAGRSAEI
jgi:hypothetical protein